MQHIGQEWKRKHLKFALEVKLDYDRAYRDAFVNQLSKTVTRLRGEPLAKNVPHTQMFQRKVACWDYNQYGLQRNPLRRLAAVDHLQGKSGVRGSREWVPWINMHQWSMINRVRHGQIFCHRVPVRGYGTDRYLRQGKWQRRWDKTFERDHLRYTRV